MPWIEWLSAVKYQFCWQPFTTVTILLDWRLRKKLSYYLSGLTLYCWNTGLGLNPAGDGLLHCKHHSVKLNNLSLSPFHLLVWLILPLSDCRKFHRPHKLKNDQMRCRILHSICPSRLSSCFKGEQLLCLSHFMFVSLEDKTLPKGAGFSKKRVCSLNSKFSPIV